MSLPLLARYSNLGRWFTCDVKLGSAVFFDPKSCQSVRDGSPSVFVVRLEVWGTAVHGRSDDGVCRNRDARRSSTGIVVEVLAS